MFKEQQCAVVSIVLHQKQLTLHFGKRLVCNGRFRIFSIQQIYVVHALCKIMLYYIPHITEARSSTFYRKIPSNLIRQFQNMPPHPMNARLVARITYIQSPTTPLRQWGFRQCLPFSWTTLRGKHCRHPIAVKGVVGTLLGLLM